MDKVLGNLVEWTNTLDSIFDVPPAGRNLKGYILECKEKNRSALYIPGCLVAVDASGDEFGVPIEERNTDYFNCDRPEILMTRGEYGIDGKIFIEGVGYKVIEGIDLPDSIELFFRDVKFDLYYTTFAMGLFDRIKTKFKF